MIFSIYYLATMALALAEWRGRLAVWRIRTPALPAAAWCAALVLTYGAQLFVAYAASQRAPWPIPLVGPVPPHADMTTFAMLALGGVQVVALVALYRLNPRTGLIVAGTAAIVALSLAAPVFVNADAYAYVGNGILGLHAYAPPSAPFPGELALINHRWGTPVPAATYGPLWLVVSRELVTVAPTLAAKLFAFRLLGAVSFAAMLALLPAAGVPSRIVAIVALNPGFAFQFVLDAHNDALALAIAIAAAAVVRRLPVLACGLLVIAALVKLPYALVALPILATVRPLPWRYFLAAAVVTAALALSWLTGGYLYLASLTTYARASQLENAVHLAAEFGAIVLLLVALAGARRLRTGSWLIGMLGAYTAPWYAAWSVPYALARRRVFAYLAIWFPLVSILVEPSFARPWTLFFVVPALAFTAIL